MAMDCNKIFLLLFLQLLSIVTPRAVLANDPDITSDFILTSNYTSLDGDFFTYSGFRGMLDKIPESFTVTRAGMAEFPALSGEGVSFSAHHFPPGGINPLHTHPRAAELLILLQGVLEVGFVDTKNVLYTQYLRVGDMFLFPKGLVHFQHNRNHKNPAIAISAFGSANPGTVSVPLSIFSAGIGDEVLAKSFNTNVDTVKKIKAGLAKH